MIKTPLFIIGYPRSGTTLLTVLLDSHPQIQLVQEPELIRAMRTSGIALSDRVSSANRSSLLKKMKAIGPCRDHLSMLPPELVSQFVEYPKDLSFKEAYEFLLPKGNDVAVWGEKSIGNMFHINDLKTLYPNALFVHIVRDPRAAILSHFRKNIARSVDALPSLRSRDLLFVLKSAMRWTAWISTVQELGKTLGPSSFIHLRFKDLVSNPEANLGTVCDALGLEFDPVMLSTTRRAEDSALAGWGVTHKKVGEPLDPSRAGSGKELPAWACSLVERFAGETMREFGFDAPDRRMRLPEKLVVEAQVSLRGRQMKTLVLDEISRRMASRSVFIPFF